ncbi:CRISPR-associated helicase Cas3' [Streptomyces sp. ST2-7A]|uniref:CRISPR-associated helicase Cas3' n=1 Tax=Streptomyces sp. ST2-7A TaxID=2907214 RepID=UPI001F257F8D|nr:CRISPR-associated helicase Cas3' [Streptomyces sp. ST2-7A]MCE7081882.1 CRISPR-associated helicase Cas3' [Streptomyces sp. ST2-7A]
MDHRTPGPRLGRALSEAAYAVWGKHDKDTDGWLPLWRHMADSGAVAGLLWDHWVPEQVRRRVAETLPAGADDARPLTVWLATVHDIGKATPAFACQVESMADRMRARGLATPSRPELGRERRLAPHATAGHHLLAEWLTRHHGWEPDAAHAPAVVVGGHHGVPPTYHDLLELNRHPRLLRTPGAEEVWTAVQRELLDAAARDTGVEPRLAAWRSLALPQAVQVALTAIVIVADWIASDSDRFPLFPDGGRSSAERIATGWRDISLPPPWRVAAPPRAAGKLFADRFALPPGAAIRPVQEAAVRLAHDLPEAGLLVIEAPMGEGKTEAALAAVEILAAGSGAGGCLIALPTMATGNAMFPRMTAWLDRLPDDRDGAVGTRSVFLAHSKAALNPEWARLPSRTPDVPDDSDDSDDSGDRRRRPADPGPAPEPGTADAVDGPRGTTGPIVPRGVEPDGDPDRLGSRPADRAASARLVAHHWLRGRKKGLLSSFCVGTIDQLLFAGLRGRHLVLRHLAVAGKVVVIDEVHAYDAHMNTYLDRVLSWLGTHRVPVVMLSATLPPERRRELVAAYAGGGAVGPPRPRLARAARRARAEAPQPFAAVAEETAHPLLTAVLPGGTEARVERPAPSGRTTTIRVEHLADDHGALTDRLVELLAGGGCALVVHNTVRRVLATADALIARFGADAVTVAHARFVDLHRAANDADLLARFGPPDRSPAAERPTGPHIVVASQVAEQSLDIDFDLLVTDLAPVDLLLQRMGRLHRHERGGPGQADRPAALRAARCLITGADGLCDPTAAPEPPRGSVLVYGRHALLRSAAALWPHLVAPDGGGAPAPIRLPADIAPLVRAAYGDGPLGPPARAKAMDEARVKHLARLHERRERARSFLLADVASDGTPLIGWVDAGVGDADETTTGRAQVRDGAESLEVLVVRRLADGTLATLPGVGSDSPSGVPLPEHTAPDRDLASSIASCGLRLPLELTNQSSIDRVISELEEACVPAWQTPECPLLFGELLLILGEDCRTSLSDFDLSYSRSRGLEVTPHAQ